MTTLTREARRLLLSALDAARHDTFDWQCGLHSDVDCLRELRASGLIECRRDSKTARLWFRLTDAGLAQAMTPEPTSFRASQQAPRALRSGGKP